MTNSIEFRLTGDVTLDDFDGAIKALRDLLAGLNREVAPGADVRWVVQDLSAGSATAVLAPDTNTQEATLVAAAYLEVGEALERGQNLPYRAAKGPARRLRQIVRGRVESIVFKAHDVEAIFEDVGAKTVAGGFAYVEGYGAVIGFLRSLSIPTQGLHAAVKDRTGYSIRCYFEEDQEAHLRELWGEYVAVEGLVRRHADSGRPVSISRITSIERRPTVGPDAWREAEGILPRPQGAPSAEEAVRRIRDA